MLGVQEERSHMSLRGERHLHAMFMFMMCFCSDFVSLRSPIIQYKDSGGERLLGKEMFEFIAYLYLWGHVYTQWGTQHSLSTCHPSLGSRVVSFLSSC